jgi:Protein of unknown function (DUF2889)
MPLTPSTNRQALHHRAISARGYKRDDGLFEVEAHLQDTKSFDFKLVSGVRDANTAIHEMWLRLIYDVSLTIIDAEAATDAAPYVGACETITPKYKQLIGMSMRPGFSEHVRNTFGSVAGCTHLTDLISIAATTAFQNLAGQLPSDATRQPYPLNRCHALALDGAVVEEFYPQWHKPDSK